MLKHELWEGDGVVREDEEQLLVQSVQHHQSVVRELSLVQDFVSDCLLLDSLLNYLKADLNKGAKCRNLSQLIIEAEVDDHELLAEVLLSRRLAHEGRVSTMDQEVEDFHWCSSLTLFMEEGHIEESRLKEEEILASKSESMREAAGRAQAKGMKELKRLTRGRRRKAQSVV